jgi:hypothetical protein
MTKLIQLLFALIGYVCTATVITLALGLFYLWRTDRLNDENMFRLPTALQSQLLDFEITIQHLLLV